MSAFSIQADQVRTTQPTLADAWVSSLDPLSRANYAQLDAKIDSRNAALCCGRGRPNLANTSLLMPKIRDTSTAVITNLQRAHRTSLKASNPVLMLDGLLLQGEQPLIPVANSLVYGTVTITAHPSQTVVDTFESGVVVVTNKRIILISAQQYQSHQFSACPGDTKSFVLSSMINGNAEVYPIPRSAITGTHFRMKDSTIFKKQLDPIPVPAGCWNSFVKQLCGTSSGGQPLFCHSPPDYQDGGTQQDHSNTRKLIVDLNLQPFGQCRMSIDFVSVADSSAVDLAKGYVKLLGSSTL